LLLFFATKYAPHLKLKSRNFPITGSADNSNMIAGLISAKNFDYWFHNFTQNLSLYKRLGYFLFWAKGTLFEKHLEKMSQK